MRIFILSTLAILILATSVHRDRCQMTSATQGAARELIEIMLRQGGRTAAIELAELGGEAAVRQLLARALNEGGEELVGRIVQYGARYGPSALKAVEPSPSRMILALDGVAPDLVMPAIRAAAREPELTARLVAVYGKDALEVAAQHPGVGATLAQKLGGDGIRIGRELTTDQAITFAHYTDDIAALPAAERNQLLDAMARAPAAALDYLEKHPRILLAAGGVAAIVAARDNLFGRSTTPPDGDPSPHGSVERVIFHGLDMFAAPIKAILAIIGGGAFFYMAIVLWTFWRMKNRRLDRDKAQAMADVRRRLRSRR